jgi:hypothetical protein
VSEKVRVPEGPIPKHVLDTLEDISDPDTAPEIDEDDETATAITLNIRHPSKPRNGRSAPEVLVSTGKKKRGSSGSPP